MTPALAAAMLMLAAPAADVSPSPTPAETMHAGPISVYGYDFRVPANEVRDGDGKVCGGDVHIEGAVGHDLLVFGGDATVDGRVGHDIVMFGGTVHLGPHADVGHDVSVLGGDLERDPGAHVGHLVSRGANSEAWNHFGAVFGSLPVGLPFGPPLGSAFHVLDGGFGLGLAAGVILLALLLHLFFPNQRTMARPPTEERPTATLGFGCLTPACPALVAGIPG